MTLVLGAIAWLLARSETAREYQNWDVVFTQLLKSYMDWKHWVVIGLVVFTAGWMLFDGIRALIVGDYITPETGESAGQLGPWSHLVSAIGIEPRSTLMKSIFVGYGLVALALAVSFALGFSWARGALIIVCILGLWYLPFGTVANVIVLFLLFTLSG